MEIKTYMESLPAVTEGINNCIAEKGALIAQCDAHAQQVLFWGLIIGAIVGAACMYAGLWYRGRKD